MKRIKIVPLDDYNQRIPDPRTWDSIGTVTQQSGNPSPRHAWKVVEIYDSDFRPTEEQEEDVCDGENKRHHLGNDVQVPTTCHYCVRWERTEEQKRIRRLVGDNGGIKFQGKQPNVREDGCSNTISTTQKDNLILCVRLATP